MCVCVCTLPREKGYHSTETSGYDNIAVLLLDMIFFQGVGEKVMEKYIKITAIQAF